MYSAVCFNIDRNLFEASCSHLITVTMKKIINTVNIAKKGLISIRTSSPRINRARLVPIFALHIEPASHIKLLAAAALRVHYDVAIATMTNHVRLLFSFWSEPLNANLGQRLLVD